MLYLTCTTISNVDLAHYGVSRAKDWVSVDCGTMIDSAYFVKSTPLGAFSGSFQHFADIARPDNVRHYGENLCSAL